MHPDDVRILVERTTEVRDALERIAASLETISRAIEQTVKINDGNHWDDIHLDAGKPDFEAKRA